MSVQEIERRQQELAPKDDLTKYVGQWVALREGHVVASDVDPVRLRDNPSVQPDDVIVPVSNSEDGYFF